MPTYHTYFFLKLYLLSSALILRLGCKSEADREHEQITRDLRSTDAHLRNPFICLGQVIAENHLNKQ